MLREHHFRERGLNGLGLGGWVHVLDFANELEVLHDGQLLEKDVKLLTKAQVLLNQVHGVTDSVTVDRGVSSCRLEHTGQHVDGGCLASAVVTEDGEDFILTD